MYDRHILKSFNNACLSREMNTKSTWRKTGMFS
uniref:Uncharacterized protein n=1 Tax=Anguilla anguilla TaxID=7936 RepID=A0A0E9PH51_ANGAN